MLLIAMTINELLLLSCGTYNMCKNITFILLIDSFLKALTQFKSPAFFSYQFTGALK